MFRTTYVGDGVLGTKLSLPLRLETHFDFGIPRPGHHRFRCDPQSLGRFPVPFSLVDHLYPSSVLPAPRTSLIHPKANLSFSFLPSLSAPGVLTRTSSLPSTCRFGEVLQTVH